MVSFFYWCWRVSSLQMLAAFVFVGVGFVSDEEHDGSVFRGEDIITRLSS